MTTGHVLPRREAPAPRIVSPAADWLLIIGSPLLALGATWALSRALGAPRGGIEGTWLAPALSALIGGHLFATFVHTHGNPGVFRAHPLRFTVVPAALFVALALSPPLRVAAIVAAVIWDVHHSGMQTFGLARILARRAGNVTGEGRTLDLLLNHVLYAGPILAGAGLLVHLSSMGPASPVALKALAAAQATPWFAWARIGLVAAGACVVGAHVWGHVRLARRGVPVSPQAMALLAGTGLTSVVSWGFNPFGMALFTMKLFHCIQYFTLVSVVERPQVAGWLGREPKAVPLALATALVVLPSLAYGAWTVLGAGEPRTGLATSLILTVTLMHFWYDGFTWSARRGTA